MLRRFLGSRSRPPSAAPPSESDQGSAQGDGPGAQPSAGALHLADERCDALPPPPPPLPPGPLGPYEPISMLGAGTFGAVVLARSAPSGELVAIKLLERGDFIRSFHTYVMRELLHHGSLVHPFIIRLREVRLLPQHLAIVMEYAAGGDLFRYLVHWAPDGRLDEGDARWAFQQLMIGVAYAHARGVANRDLKLENLLLEQGPAATGVRPLLKICDFGYSKHELNSCAKTGVGTPVYMAPEVIYGGNRYDAKLADLWSCGVVLYTLLYGRYPFDRKHPDYPRAIVTAQYSFPPDVPVSASARDLLARILVADPAHRLSMAEIQAHPWFAADLPPGAAAMNDWYLQHAPSLHAAVPLCERIVGLAGRPGAPGDPELCVSFEQLQEAALSPPPGAPPT